MASPAKILLDWKCSEIESLSWINGTDRDYRVDPLGNLPWAKVIKTAEIRRLGSPRIVRDYTWDIYLYFPGIKKIEELSIIDDQIEEIRILFEEREGLFPFFGIHPDETKYVGFRVDSITALGKDLKKPRIVYLMQTSLPVIPSEFRAR